MTLDGMLEVVRLDGGVCGSLERCLRLSRGHGARDRIEVEDILALNRTMRARSPHSVRAPITERRLPWLGAISADLDLIEADDAGRRARGATS